MDHEKKTLKLTASIGWDGGILPPGHVLEADKELADNLIARGRAVLATDEDKAQAAEAASSAA